MEKEWYRYWFASEDYLDVYRHRNDLDTDKLISLILGSVDIPVNAKILDAACGAGRHAIRFAELGYEVTGFDLSKTLLNLAQEEAQNKHLDVEFIEADIRHFNIATKFDLITNLFTSFGYFDTDEENFLFIKNAYDMLITGGYYVFDYLNEMYLKNNLVVSSEKIVRGKEIFEKRSILNNRIIKNIKIVKDQHNSEFLESVKLYSYEELVNQFSKMGYKLVKAFGDYDGNKYDSEVSERCIIIFQK